MFPSPDKWEPGIYFGLDEDLYHKLPWCGSSDMKMLYSNPPDYWFGSHMNANREVEEESFALQFGSALHHRILYGEESFKRDYTPLEGGNKDGTIEAERLKKWIEEQGGHPSKLKADNERMVKKDFNTTLVARKTYDKIAVAAQMIVKNPYLTQAFSGGWPEVSVFWHRDGVPCKARFDYLKREAIVDLKSFRSKERIRQINEWITQDLFNYRYDIQAAHYMHGHSVCANLVQAGKVFGVGPRPANEWLAKAFAKPPQWVFVFYKADGMPISKSYQVPFGGDVHQCGEVALKLAIDNYRDNMEKFGTDAWVNMDEPYMLDNENIPKWL